MKSRLKGNQIWAAFFSYHPDFYVWVGKPIMAISLFIGLMDNNMSGKSKERRAGDWLTLGRGWSINQSLNLETGTIQLFQCFECLSAAEKKKKKKKTSCSYRSKMCKEETHRSHAYHPEHNRLVFYWYIIFIFGKKKKLKCRRETQSLWVRRVGRRESLSGACVRGMAGSSYASFIIDGNQQDRRGNNTLTDTDTTETIMRRRLETEHVSFMAPNSAGRLLQQKPTTTVGRSIRLHWYADELNRTR